VISGQELFTGADGKAMPFGSGSLVIFEAGETHIIQVADANRVFIAFMRKATGRKTTPETPEPIEAQLSVLPSI
jgi:uncharacterized protein YjlB